MTDQNSGKNWFTTGWTDLGMGLSYKFTGCNHRSDSGLMIKDEQDGIKGGISFCNECSGPTWELVNREPLTVTPSLHDPTTGWHGFITDGKWVPC